MLIASEAAARAQAWALDAGSSARRFAARVLAEIRLTVDLPHWRAATNWPDRLRALSWPRVAVLSGVFGLVIASALGIYELTRPYAYPPQEPTARELALRQHALENVRPAPPPGLVEANKSWDPE